MMQIEREALLVPPEHEPARRLTVAQGRIPPCRITIARMLDLDHLGAELAEQGRRQRTREARRYVQHPNAGQGTWRHAYSFRSGSGRKPPGRTCSRYDADAPRRREDPIRSHL